MMYFLLMAEKTAFFKFEDIFKECYLYREKAPMVEPLVCLREDNICHVGHNCMENLLRRLHALFDEVVPEAELILLYYAKRNVPGIGAGVFWSDFQTPRVIDVNSGGWEQLKRRSELYKFDPSPSFFLTGKSLEPEESSEDKVVVLE